MTCGGAGGYRNSKQVRLQATIVIESRLAYCAVVHTARKHGMLDVGGWERGSTDSRKVRLSSGKDVFVQPQTDFSSSSILQRLQKDIWSLREISKKTVCIS